MRQESPRSRALPVSRLATLVSNREDGHFVPHDVIPHGVREMFEVIEVHSVFILGPVACSLLQTVDGMGYLGAECISRKRASFEVPKEPFAHVRFRVGKYGNGEARHSERKRCFTSVQGVARTLPVRPCAARTRLLRATHVQR
jgi:hypothetical protein